MVNASTTESNAVAVAKSAQNNAAVVQPDSLSLNELTRVMDVATALRKQRNEIQKQFNLEETKQLLRAKLIETAEVTGERLTDAEIDAAIEQYFDSLYAYEEPPLSPNIMLAQLYVRRRIVAWSLAAVALAVVSIWAGTGISAERQARRAEGLWQEVVQNREAIERAANSDDVIRQVRSLEQQAELSRDRRDVGNLQALVAKTASLRQRLETELERTEALWTQFAGDQQAIEAVTSDEDLLAKLRSQMQQAELSRQRRDVDKLATLAEETSALRQQLEGEYQIVVISQPGRQSAVDRYFTDESGQRMSGYYLIVEARRADGSLYKVRIRNRETGQQSLVEKWAEQVPKEVYDRLARDKQEDGVLDETLFAKKRSGSLESEIVMAGPDGMPLERQGQITQW